MELEADFLKQQNNQILSQCNMHFVIEKTKRVFRSLWIARINAASRSMNVSYSKLINGMTSKNIIIDRKILSEIAINDSMTFEKIVQASIK